MPPLLHMSASTATSNNDRNNRNNNNNNNSNNSNNSKSKRREVSTGIRRCAAAAERNQSCGGW